MYALIQQFIKTNKFLYSIYSFFKTRFLKLICIVISDEFCCKRLYKKGFNKNLNLENPVTFNEKIQWLKLRCRNNIYTVCADKYAVRDYVKDRIGDAYLTKLYGIYNTIEEINPKNLPHAFVLKTTHGSSQNLICKDKTSLVWPSAIANFTGCLHYNYYFFAREWAYKNIPPRLICEEYLDDNGASPNDYKFFCFNGTPKFIQVDVDRFGNHRRNIYDMDWNLLPFTIRFPGYEGEVPKPLKFDLMTDLAKKLSEGFPFARVDLYCIGERVVFGELTFYPGAGFEHFFPEKYDEEIGKLLKLPV